MKVATENYVYVLSPSENITISAVNYFNPSLAFSSRDYINKVNFRLIKILGPYSEEVSECSKLTFAIFDSMVSKRNHYCYDPFSATFKCETVRL